MDLGMNFNDAQWLTIVITVCAISYLIGKREGIRATIDYMVEKKMISFDDD